MEYKRIENKIVFRLEMGEGLMESTQRIATAENVKLASINGIGACSKIEMGYFDLSIKYRYIPLALYFLVPKFLESNYLF